MKSDGERLYIGRKRGRGMGVKWTLSSLLPALLIFLITAVLVFAMVFISSMTTAIDRMIIMLGSSSIVTEEEVDVSSWSGASINKTREGEGVVFTEEGKSIIRLKGVNESYLQGEREEALKIVRSGEEVKNAIIVSTTLARKLNLELGSSMTMMLYEKEKNRTRPILMTVTGIFDSGYAQLDRYLAYVDFSLLDGEEAWEILLDQKDDLEKRCQELEELGISYNTYREKYSALYLNVRQSVSILYLILAFVALLAAFFSTDIVSVYLSRDRQDIAALRLLGMEEKRIRRIYLSLSLFAVAVSALGGTVLGLLLGLLSPSLIRIVASSNPGLVEYYISSFSVTVPTMELLLMVLAMVVLSAITLFISLSTSGRKELMAIVSDR
ncbi:MAG: FtsX-like permease family protein [Candidatus Ornithospirochaeta sp.]|nr:FtsX-like permease family protein [Sphaerochaetaceae bacterium]MDY5522686.1 FtsX-like permease family protein [Candidatus Ornithospirochaeta sp.]